MRKELEDELYQDFPQIFKYLNYGFQCGDGWFHLIQNLCIRLTLTRDLIRAQQVKEKFGTLRFYTDRATDAQQHLIDDAENMSAQICEMCGDSGKLRQGSWIRTLCDKHAKEMKYKV